MSPTSQRAPFDPGRRPDPPDDRDHLYRQAVQQQAITRPSVYRRIYLGPNLNQGQTPHCVAYSGTSIKNREERLDHGSYPFASTEDQFQPGQNTYAEWLYAECKKIDGFPGDGTDARSALKVMQSQGLLGPNGSHYKIGQYARLNSVEEIMEAIYVHGPVYLGMTVDSTWFSPLQEGTKFARLDKPNDDIAGGHEIEAVGYRDKTTTPEELQGILIKNSWGSDYGYNGFVRVPFEHFDHYNDWDAWWLEDAVGIP